MPQQAPTRPINMTKPPIRGDDATNRVMPITKIKPEPIVAYLPTAFSELEVLSSEAGNFSKSFCN